MKLKNKEENRLEELEGIYVADGKIFMTTIDEDGKRNLQSFDSLAELQETFEDSEEPKSVWYIDDEGNVSEGCADADWTPEKEIGNYFETEEEAEKAVEKLKAWKRLRDKGIKAIGWHWVQFGKGDIEIALDNVKPNGEQFKDIDLLFSQEVKNDG